MARAQSHVSSSPARLETLSATARTRSAVFARLSVELALHDGDDIDGDSRIAAVVAALLEGKDAIFSSEELEFLRRVGVPRALVAGDTREGR